jgi:hypothetical protein
VCGTFALVRAISTTRTRKTWIDRGSFALAIGFGAGTIAALAWQTTIDLFWDAGIITLGAIVGALSHMILEALFGVRQDPEAPCVRPPSDGGKSAVPS